MMYGFVRTAVRELTWTSAALVLCISCDDPDSAAAPDRRAQIEYHLIRTIGRGHLDDPMGIAVTSTEVLVADTGRARVARFTRAGEPDGEIEGDGLVLVRPMDVARTPDGAVWIADFGADAVWRVADGRAEVIQTVEAPAGLGLAGEDVLVAAFYAHRITRVDRAHTEVFVGGEGGGDGQLHYPTDVAEDERGSLYVADSYNHRIQVFDGQGRFMRALQGGEDRLHVPVSVVVRDGVAHVADSGHHRVVALDVRTGEVRGEYRLDASRGGPHTPARLALTARGRLLVADPGGDAVYELEIRRRSS